jgi:hypothetical protein
MAKSTEVERGSSQVTDAADNFRETAGGAILANRLVVIASDGDVEQATFNSTAVVGVNRQEVAVAAGDQVRVGYGRCVVVADQAITAGQPLKAASGGRVMPFADSELTGDTIEDNVGLGFANQPANDGVEVVSASAADDPTFTVTAWYTRDSLGDTVYTETIALNGTTQVVFTHTDIALVLAVEKSAATTGTITFREASANATIITLPAATLSSGKITVTAAQVNAYNTAPTAVGDAATTKQVGLIGTDEDGATLLDSQALAGTTAVTFNDTFKTVTFLLLGDLETARTVTVKVGTDAANLRVGRALEAATAQDSILDAWIMPT